MEEENRQEDDILLERALEFLDPEQSGRTSFERILAFDFRPLEQLLSRESLPVSGSVAINLIRYHRMERLKGLLLPFLEKDGPLCREIDRASRIASHPYRKKQSTPSSPGLSSSV
ncbi:hypothetical protein LptCag_2045 [Leptospirillum ferriphilum]|uniref:Uncharacterized protein n=2 Tax=Leptospirillum TaxID=179 RepID=A0A094WDP3_9BACT|nr:hypothetical protein [Leptospirillum ferriphilum]EDZ39990.1 MAG: Hypothetical protein CGL2_11111011 [Leptospirillum sp. Group II '5-way CG']KGA94615.1 hypothetical protein LptCag_2045 [Leptospirillum ferriphilum]